MLRAGLIGGKLGHSYSPWIHQLIWQKLGIVGKYELMETSAEALPFMLQQLRQEFVGVNVTIPHKILAHDLAEELAPEAEAIGAVNTLAFAKDKIIGHNTDYSGFGAMLRHAGVSLVQRSAVVLGEGGAARCVCAYLQNYGVPYRIFSRRRGFSWEQLQGEDLLINCTPVGMYPEMEQSLVPAEHLPKFRDVVDLIYNPAETLLLRQAREAGCNICNGQYMLVAQAVAAEEIWLGRKLPENLIEQVYSEMQWGK